MLNFQNPVFEELYKKDFFIEESTLREILALGKEAAAPELEKIVADVLDRFDPDSPEAGELDGDGWHRNFYFMHALFLLHELDAESSLPLLLRLLRKDEAFQEYWFGDNIYEEVPELLAKTGRNQLPALTAVMNDRTYSLRNRILVGKALTYIAALYPDERPAVIEFFRDYLGGILKLDDNEIAEAFPTDQGAGYDYEFPTFLAFLLSDLEKINPIELESEIRQCYRRELVDESITGDEEDISFYEEAPELFADIFKRYEDLKRWPGEDSPFHPDAENIRRRKALEVEQHLKKLAELQKAASARSATPAPMPAPAGPKIERNAPCPCGSGKKYKKCCY